MVKIDWIFTEDELPSCDGYYEITNHPEFEEDTIRREVTATATYDGFGFEHLGVYRNPTYWRKMPEPMIKKYGKVENK